MLYWSLMFLLVALIAAALGFSGVIVGTAVGIAKVLFFVFLVMFVLSLFTGAVRRPL